MVKRGDAVCLPLYVAGVQGDGVILSSNPNAAKVGHGNAFAMLEEVAPWHDALPAVAAWLQTYPDAHEALSKLFVPGVRLGCMGEERRRVIVEELIAALETGAGK
jgi:hypothetical protein